jgi:AcrR family transcriptional regulator
MPRVAPVIKTAGLGMKRKVYTVYPSAQAILARAATHRIHDVSSDVTSHILSAAIDVFVELGFSAARVEDILESAGVARRTFYRHFGSKEAVLAAIYERAIGELLSAVQSAGTAAPGDPFDAIYRGLDAYLDYHVAHAKLVRILVQQAIRSDSPLAPARRRFRQELTRLLDAAVRASTGEEHDPLFYAALISAVEGVSLELLAGKVGKKEVERAKTVLHLLLERTLLPR